MLISVTASQAPPIKPLFVLYSCMKVAATLSTNTNSCWRSYCFLTADQQLPICKICGSTRLRRAVQLLGSQSQWYKVQLSLWNDAMSPAVLSQNTALISLAFKWTQLSLLAGVTLYSGARRNCRGQQSSPTMNLLYKILPKWSLGLCSLAVMGIVSSHQESEYESSYVQSASMLHVAPAGPGLYPLWSHFVFCAQGALWRCEDNSRGPGFLGLKMPYTVDWVVQCMVIRSRGHAHAFTLSPFGKPVVRDLISPMFCWSLEFIESKNILIFWMAHWERVWFWGTKEEILWFQVKVAMSRGGEEVPTLSPLSSPAAILFFF